MNNKGGSHNLFDMYHTCQGWAVISESAAVSSSVGMTAWTQLHETRLMFAKQIQKNSFPVFPTLIQLDEVTGKNP